MSAPPTLDVPSVSRLVQQWLVCPESHAPISVTGDRLHCSGSDWSGEIRDRVAVMMPLSQASFFDDKFEVMEKGHQGEGEWNFCYAQQVALLESYLEPGTVLLDVGCGPSLPYHPPPGTVVIGLEPSFASIRANHEVSLGVYGSAYAIPLAAQSVDVVVCFYSIHHMVGADRASTAQNVQRAFYEFGRVLKPGGLLFIFEMTPISLFASVQKLIWDPIRKYFPQRLDMHFWSARSLAQMGNEILPQDSHLEKIFFETSSFTVFPPVFSLPWLKVPRLIYPLDAKLYKWRIAAAPARA